MGIEIVIVIFLVALGIALLLAEIFFLPGISIAGFAGALSLLAGIIYAFAYIGNTAGLITAGSAVVIGGGAFVYLIKSNAMNRIALKTDIDSKVDTSEIMKIKEGDIGRTLSRLNPIGKIEIDNIIVEAKSFDGEFIDDGLLVEVVKVNSSNVVVREKISTENNQTFINT